MQAINISRLEPISEEDIARADWYGLVAKLFSAPLDEASLRQLAGLAKHQPAKEDTDLLGQALLSLGQAAFTMQGASGATQLKEEFDTVFVGTGKAEVFLNASYYQSGFLHEKPLVDLRSMLNRLGYARKEEVADTEDHLSLLCGTMRRLILDRAPIDEQKQLFTEFMADWFETACNAIEANGYTDFYKHAARLWKAFFEVERQSFDFED